MKFSDDSIKLIIELLETKLDDNKSMDSEFKDNIVMLVEYILKNMPFIVSVLKVTHMQDRINNGGD